jgi:two-component system phosphate regulon sensor histidine kinase PhoR
MRLKFSQKIIVGQILLFLVFVLCAFPFIEKASKRIVYHTLHANTKALIGGLKRAANEPQMIEMLKSVDKDLFFGVAIYDAHGDLLYDSVAGDLQRLERLHYVPENHIDVDEVLKKRRIDSVSDPSQTGKKLAYITIPFQVKGNTYFIRASFSYTYVSAFTEQFQVWFLVFCLLAALFFAIVMWLGLHRINYPLDQIIKAIKPYQTGQIDLIPKIILSESITPEDDFYRLAETLNSLSERVRLQIKSLVDERNEKEAILESLGEGVVAVDSSLNIRYVNFIGSKMLGIPKRYLLGKPFPTLTDKPSVPLLDKCRSLLEICQEKSSILTDSISLGESKKIYLDLIAAPKEGGNGAIIVLQDKSSHYRVLEMGKDFVANASHELRTPITIIRGFAETLQDMPELPPEMLSDIIEKIVRNCQRMDNLVKSLLTLADIENLPLSRFQECDLIALAENCRQFVLAVYEHAQIAIEKIKESVTVFADPDILELAIINLMDNAAKYSHPPAQITVTIDQQGEEACIAIRDQGIGIPAQDLEHIFDRFYTVNKAHSRRLGGAGLGLSIVKTIIEKHEGTIAVTSILGKGTTFTISLPSHRKKDFAFVHEIK